MTFRTSINSKGDPKKMLKRGFKSMFANYDEKTPTTQPVETKEKPVPPAAA